MRRRLSLFASSSQGLVSVEFRLDALPVRSSSKTTWRLRRLVQLWFAVGVVVGAATSVIFTSFLVWNLARALIASSSLAEVSKATAEHMTPLVPGVNLPWGDLVYLVAAIAPSAAWVRNHAFLPVACLFSDVTM